MAVPSIYKVVDEFKACYHAECCKFEEGLGYIPREGKIFKKNHVASNNIQKINHQALESINSWKETPDSLPERIKHKFSNLLKKAPDCEEADIDDASWWKKPPMWLGRQVHRLGTRIASPPKESAAVPYEFNRLSDDEMKALEKKANFIRIVANTVLVASVILIIIGVAAPFALVPLLVTLPPLLAGALIAGCTIGGVAGVAGVIGYSLIIDHKAVNEYEAEKDEGFHRFVNEFVQDGRKGDFNVKKSDIQNGKLYKIYQEWKGALENELSEKRIERLKKEREKARTL